MSKLLIRISLILIPVQSIIGATVRRVASGAGSRLMATVYRALPADRLTRATNLAKSRCLCRTSVATRAASAAAPAGDRTAR